MGRKFALGELIAGPWSVTRGELLANVVIAQTLVDLAATFEPRYPERAYTEAQVHPFFDKRELAVLLERPPKGVKELRKLACLQSHALRG